MNALLSRPAPAEHMGPCSYCGLNWGSTHSARYECGGCWDYRKLDRPAARHWAKVLLPLFSNIDFYDQTHFFPDAGADSSFLSDAQRVLLRSKLLLKHGPEHTWSDEVNRSILTMTPLDLLRSLLTDADDEILRNT